jgi:TolB protein
MGPDGTSVMRLTSTKESEGVAGWSADGSRVVYNVVSGDSATLYAISLGGGPPTRVGMARGQGARTTRDGARVIYGVMPWQTMQLFVAGADGSNPRRLTPGSSAFYCSALSPDDRQVATSRSDSGSLQIWLFALDGSSSRQLTRFTPEQGHAQCPAWSSDGRRLAIQSDVFDRENPKNATSHIWVIDVATGAATKLAAHAQPYRDELPAWFPDGRRIAFQSDRTGRWEVWVMSADGSDVRQLTR